MAVWTGPRSEPKGLGRATAIPNFFQGAACGLKVGEGRQHCRCDSSTQLLAARLFSRRRLSLASSFRNASFGTLRSLATALSNRSNSVLPGTWWWGWFHDVSKSSGEGPMRVPSVPSSLSCLGGSDLSFVALTRACFRTLLPISLVSLVNYRPSFRVQHNSCQGLPGQSPPFFSKNPDSPKAYTAAY